VQPPAATVQRPGAPLLIKRVAGHFDLVVLLQPPGRLEEAVVTVAGDRPLLLLTMSLQLPASCPQPLLASTRAGDRRPRLERHILSVRVAADGPAFAFCNPPLRVRQRLPAALRGAQLLGQLIAALVAVELVLAAVGFFRLTEDLADDLAVDALGWIFVPSIVITPTDTNPASRHRPSTSSNRSAISDSCRRRNSAIVE
jgi:hypothetical protein